VDTSPERHRGEGEREHRPAGPPTDAFSYGPESSAPVGPGTAEVPTTERPPDRPGPGDPDEERRGPLHFLRELPGLIIIALILALVIKSFLIQAFFIPSQSMEPTLQVGDRVLVNKLGYRFREPRRGEVIVFENPQHVEQDRNPVAAFWNWVTEGLGFTSDPNKDFIKWLVALPGDTIEVRGGRVFVNGERVREPYLSEHRDVSDYGPFTVPEGHLFVMGDNRVNSQDSRSPAVGPVPEENVVGRAFIILWPPSSFEWLSAGD
jgi:signal peptidase I